MNVIALKQNRFYVPFFILLIITILFISGCPMKPVQGLDNKESTLLRFYSFYNSQFMDYQRLTANPDDLSEEKKEVLRKKRDMLEELYPLIELYRFQLDNKSITSVETEQKILDLINRIE